VNTTPASPGSPSIETQVAQLIARSEIGKALNDYVLGIDGRDKSRWLAAFHEDAIYEVDFPKAVVKGHEEILSWVREPWEFQTITHITGNHHIDAIDNDYASGRGRGVGIFKIKDGSVILATATLDDRYLKRGGAWKISYRKVTIISSFLLNDATALILNGVAQ
jgi:SnoaL-like protein